VTDQACSRGERAATRLEAAEAVSCVTVLQRNGGRVKQFTDDLRDNLIGRHRYTSTIGQTCRVMEGVSPTAHSPRARKLTRQIEGSLSILDSFAEPGPKAR